MKEPESFVIPLKKLEYPSIWIDQIRGAKRELTVVFKGS